MFKYIRVVDNVVKEETEETIQGFVFHFVRTKLDEETSYDVEGALMSGVTKLFSNVLLRSIPTKKIRFYSDTKDSCCDFFKNGILKTTPNEIKITQYSELGETNIWANQVLDSEIRMDHDGEASDFEKFVEMISRDESSDRRICFETAIGYLRHNFYNPSILKAIACIDSGNGLEENPHGRSGKGLLINGISKTRKLALIDGKNFDPQDRFSFQNVELDTQIIFFDDVHKRFDMEYLFSQMTERYSSQEKNKKRFQFQRESNPKTAITSNYILKGDGESYQDRIFILMFSNHFNKDHKPEAEFGRFFFYQWNDEEWQRFYWYCALCSQKYLRHGLVEGDMSEYMKRRKKAQLDEELIDFLDEITLELRAADESKNIRFKLQIGSHESDIDNLGLVELYSSRLNQQKKAKFDKEYKPGRFKTMISTYCTAEGLTLNRSGATDGRIRINGIEFIEIDNYSKFCASPKVQTSPKQLDCVSPATSTK